MAAPRWDAAMVLGALGRAGFGGSPDEVTRVAGLGWENWVEEQLRPNDAADGECHRRLQQLKLHIKYNAAEKWSAVDEMRPLTTLDQPIEAVWPLITKRAEMDGAERRRPRDEVIAATILRACYSRWGLREAMVGFWHDHFNVDAYGSEQVAVALPSYDRGVIRRHALGNFRAFLEGVATSAAMLYYLSNRSSRAGAANENYARELFELHTLGRDAYFNDRYDRWRNVPGALRGAPTGYIDQDVYEAARALTGWTVEDGTNIDAQRKLPETGRFVYVEGWHDGYQKRVLAREFDAFQPAMADGRKVLDLVAEHPATAHFLCSKLCRRFIGASVGRETLAAAIDTWTQSRARPDQIARVMRVILTSKDFAQATGAKLRRPLNLAAAFVRGVGLDVAPSEGLANALAAAGQRLFGWPTPTGLPDDPQIFIGTNAMRQRWALLLGLAENWWGTGNFDATHAMGAPSPHMAVARFLTGLLGRADPALAAAILGGLGMAPSVTVGLQGAPDTEKKLARIAAVCGMAPAFQAV
jgi:uncharacterized protein (DUF1800 family)